MGRSLLISLLFLLLYACVPIVGVSTVIKNQLQINRWTYLVEGQR